ncbi:DUF4345 domain-containing protein [Hyphomicrobiales bacterium]|nr:DUF4345 domain-containing protein [Hyphomicrobiales bacterium]
MKSLINIFCYALGLMWLILGLVGVYDPMIFAKNDIVSLNVVIQSPDGKSEIRALAGMFSFMGLGILLASHQPDSRKQWFKVFSLLMIGLAIGRSVGFLPYFEGVEEKRVIYAGIEYLMAFIFFIRAKI